MPRARPVGRALRAPAVRRARRRICRQPCRRRRAAGRLGMTVAEVRCLPPINLMETTMLRWALIFAVIALVAGVFGFTGIEAGAADIARTLFYVFVAFVIVFLVLGVTIFKR
jgi:uncharacterized membrane protein YtjA (UPF0391 family)